MRTSKFAVMMALGVAVAGGLSGCDRMKGAAADLRNGQIDVAETACSDNAKLSSLMLQNGHYQLGGYDFSLQGDIKHGDVFGYTQPGTPPAAVFVGNCVADGEASQVLFVYGTDENDKPKRLAVADLSDADGGKVESFAVEDGTIVVEQTQDGKPAKTTYALLNGKMTNLTTGETAYGGAGSDTISLAVFHNKLQPFGQWIDHPRWGEAWHPFQADFKPYENGRWEDSNEYGTVFVSNYPWEDIPSHYGHWFYDQNYGGWLWIPGYVWGPGWVVWRVTDQYVGWFPMPPGYDGEGEYTDDWNDWYGYRGSIGDEAFYGLWTFVAPDDIYAANVRMKIVDRRGYGSFLRGSKAWTSYGLRRGHVFSNSLDRGRFKATFRRDPPASRHDFRGAHVTSLRAGRVARAHDASAGNRHFAPGQGNGGGGHGRFGTGFGDVRHGHDNRTFSRGGQPGGAPSFNAGGGHSRSSMSGSGFQRHGGSQHGGNAFEGGGQHRNGFSRSEGFSHGDNAPQNGGGGGNSFANTGSYRHGGGYTRTMRGGDGSESGGDGNGLSGGGYHHNRNGNNGGGSLFGTRGGAGNNGGGGNGAGSLFGTRGGGNNGGGGGNGGGMPSFGPHGGNNGGGGGGSLFGGGNRPNGGGNRPAPPPPRNENHNGGGGHHHN